MPQTIWIARHANRLDFVRPEWFNTAAKRYDTPLSSDGLFQAYRLGQRLKSESIDRIFASPFLRAIQTADSVATALQLNVQIERGLGEWMNPEWMKEVPDLNYPQALERKYSNLDRDYISKIIPQYPEDEAKMRQRMSETIRALLAEYTDNILIVSHGDPIKGIITHLTQKSDSFAVPLCSLSKLVCDRHSHPNIWQLEIQADTSHLDF